MAIIPVIIIYTTNTVIYISKSLIVIPPSIYKILIKFCKFDMSDVPYYFVLIIILTFWYHYFLFTASFEDFNFFTAQRNDWY